MSTVNTFKYYIKQSKKLYNQYLIFKSLKRNFISSPNILNYKLLSNNVKKSNTLFILGSGSSINDMTEKNFKLIQKNNSIGFNNWTLHEFVPDYYTLDFKDNNIVNEKIAFAQIHNFNHRYTDYKNVHFILRLNRSYPKYVKHLNTFNNLHFGFQLAISGATSFDYRDNIKFLISTKLINSNHVFYNKNSSVHNAIMFAYKMKYKKVVLCGIDLLNTKYFYDHNKENIKSRGLILTPKVQTSKIHKTNHPTDSAGGLPISKIITVLNEVLLKPNNIELYIATKKSALYPQLPIFKW